MSKIWTTKSGEKIPYNELTDKHLENIINMLSGKISEYEMDSAFAWGYSGGDMASYYAEQDAVSLDNEIARLSGILFDLNTERVRREAEKNESEEDLLKNYVKAINDLDEYFGTKIVYNIVLLTEDNWSASEDDVFWNNSEYEDEFEYSSEIYRGMKYISKDNKYTMFVADDHCGNRDCYIFNNELRID